MNLGNRHWEALAYFHTLNTIVFFNSSGTEEEHRTNRNSELSRAVENQRRFISGSKAALKKGEKLSVIFQPHGLQKDYWARGLWCMGFVHTIVELQPERRALGGEEISYNSFSSHLKRT